MLINLYSKRTWLFISVGLLLMCYLLWINTSNINNVLSSPKSAPAFTQTSAEAWLNSEPLTLKKLRGKVVLLDFWTFDCWNCYRSFPWLNSLEAKYEDQGLQVIGIHTPEFKHEKVRANVEKKIKQFGLKHPVMMDNDFGYWRAMGNRYWPAFYLIDKKGQVRALFVGETHIGDRRSKAIEMWVMKLLAEELG